MVTSLWTGDIVYIKYLAKLWFSDAAFCSQQLKPAGSGWGQNIYLFLIFLAYSKESSSAFSGQSYMLKNFYPRLQINNSQKCFSQASDCIFSKISATPEIVHRARLCLPILFHSDTICTYLVLLFTSLFGKRDVPGVALASILNCR